MIREATAADMAAVTRIHNDQAIASTNSYDWTPFDEQHWMNWLASQQLAGRPCLVAELDDQVVGYATWMPFRGKAGWQFTVEHSVYLAADAVGRGLGRALMTELIARARERGVHVMVAVIDDANQDSQRFHEALGFELMGVIREGGRKFDRWLDCAFWTLQLD